MFAAFPCQDYKERKEKENIAKNIHDGLPPRRQSHIEKVHAHMALETVAIGGAKHGIGAIHHIRSLEDPGRGFKEHVAHRDVVAYNGREHDDQQTRDLSRPNTGPINEAENFLHTNLHNKKEGSSSHN